MMLQIGFIGYFFVVYQKMEKAAEKQATYTQIVLVSRHLENEFSDAALMIGMVTATKTKPTRQSFEAFRTLVMGTKRQLELVTPTTGQHEKMINSIYGYLDGQLRLLDNAYKALSESDYGQASIISQQMYQRSREQADKYEKQIGEDLTMDMTNLTHRNESTLVVFGGALGALIMAIFEFVVIRKIIASMTEY